MRVGHFSFLQESRPITGDLFTPHRLDTGRSVTTAGTREFGDLSIRRTTAKAIVSRFVPRWMGVEHDWRAGVQLERGAHDATSVLPGGVRYLDSNDVRVQSISADPSSTGGLAITASAFASDAVTIGGRLSISAGLRLDHARAIVPDLPAVDLRGQETGEQVEGLGTVYRWNVLSPRLGTVLRLTRDGRTVARASVGRFHAGVLTGEISPFHPGEAVVTTRNFVEADGDYTVIQSRLDPATNGRLDPRLRSPHTDELSVGVDRQLGGQVTVAAAYVHKTGRDFVGWTDERGQYTSQQRTLADGSSVEVSVLTSASNDRRFLLTNPPEYSMTYDGLVVAIEKRRRNGWHASGSYTLSRAFGLQASGGASAAAPQVTTVAPPPAAGLTFGQNPNDLTNARGRLPNDRPHVLRAMASGEVPRAGLLLAANFQYFSGKPWAASATVRLEGTPRRILLEPRGYRRLSSQSLLDVRISRPFRVGPTTTIHLAVDVLNALNDTAEEGLVSDVVMTEREMSSNFGLPSLFMDPRRAMFSARVGWGR